MLKKVLTGTGIAAALTAMFFLGSLAVSPAFAQGPTPTNPPAQTQVDEQQPKYTGSIQVKDSQYEGMSEADEAAALQSKATITAGAAEQAALAANPGTSVIKTGLDNENGVLVYSVELSNGMDVKVDAGTGKVIHTEQAGNDATEVAGAENTLEQEAVED